MGNASKEQYKAIFLYSDEVLQDFEAMYLHKSAVSPLTRLLTGLLGLAGVILFGVLIVRKGFSVGFLIPIIFFGLIFVMALMLGRKKTDASVQRYRKHYLNKKAHFLADDTGIELKLNGQKSYARSKYKDIYNLLETDETLFFEIKGRAFYIVPKQAVDGGAEALKAYAQKRCGKRFQHMPGRTPA